MIFPIYILILICIIILLVIIGILNSLMLNVKFNSNLNYFSQSMFNLTILTAFIKNIQKQYFFGILKRTYDYNK